METFHRVTSTVDARLLEQWVQIYYCIVSHDAGMDTVSDSPFSPALAMSIFIPIRLMMSVHQSPLFYNTLGNAPVDEPLPVW